MNAQRGALSRNWARAAAAVIAAVAFIAFPLAAGFGQTPTSGASTSPTTVAKDNQLTSGSASQKPIVDFNTTVLAGGAVNTLTISQAMDRVAEPITAEFRSTTARRGKQVFSCHNEERRETSQALTKTERTEDVDGGKRTATVVTIWVPNPHCDWPPWQQLQVTVRRGADSTPLLVKTMSVSVFWFPFAVALAVVGIIYPGCALIVWYIKKRRFERMATINTTDAPPEFWPSLDPVQITANPYGRASLGKLQIFGFTLLIFGLMLYYQLRTGILITLSTDILALLGISAVGATGGKLTALAKRRLSFPNWAWLRRNGWLPNRTDDFAPRAQWRELITDFDGKEFDVYSFQMAIFSLIVAVALVSTNFAGAETFHIPAELLGLLGISQGVFIVGRAAGTSAYQELDTALNDVRKKADAYLSLRAEGPSKQTEAAAALATFRQAVQQAATMFWDVYGPETGKETKPPALAADWLQNLTPDTEPPALSAKPT